jgi:outer membrane lipoprotein-sorting protein
VIRYIVKATEHNAAHRMKRLFPLVALLLAASTLQRFNASAGAAEPTPSAREILDSVRMRQAQQQIDLRGQLRQNEIVVPFQLIQSGSVVRYLFSNPDEALQLQLGENDSRLEEVTREGVEKVQPAQFNRKIRGTDVTYEDLSLKFLYWSNAQLIGTETITTGNCWKLELRPAANHSQYTRVVVWVHQNSGALVRLEGYDSKAQLVKRFNVVSAQKIHDRWYLKQMRIETFQPGTNHVLSRTYLEINKS